MMILTNGNVGIGTTSPAFALDVTGDTRATGCVKYGTGSGTSLGGTCASDARFKQDVTSITGALSRISLLRPVHYRYKTDEFPGRGFGTDVEAGFIAQELREVFPSLVVEGDDGYLKVRYGLDLQMETIAAVKELKTEKDAEITQLKAESAQLKAEKDSEVAQLKAESAQLKAESAQLKAFLCSRFAEAPMCH